MESRIGRILGLCLVLCAFVLSCSKPPHKPPSPLPAGSVPGLKSQKPYQIRGTWYYPLPSAEGFSEEGIASWYGADFHGKPTACGEPYDMWAMTAAHKTLPLGTHVKVTNLQNNRTTVLRVNDRGPFVGGRVIDLSCKAAQELGCYGRGTAPVRIEAVQVASEIKVGQDTLWKVDPVPSFRYGRFTVQIGAFRDGGNARRLRDRMAASMEARITQATDKHGNLYRVQVGMHQDLLLARQEVDRLRGRGFADAFVLAVDAQ